MTQTMASRFERWEGRWGTARTDSRSADSDRGLRGAGRGRLPACRVDVRPSGGADGDRGAVAFEDRPEYLDAIGRRTPHRVPRGGVERDEIDVGPDGRGQAGEMGGLLVAVVDPVDHRPLERDPPSGLLAVVGARFHQRRYRVALVDRYELVAELLGGRME